MYKRGPSLHRGWTFVFFDTLPVAVNQKASAIGKRLNVSKKEINQTLYGHGELFSSTFFVWKLRS